MSRLREAVKQGQDRFSTIVHGDRRNRLLLLLLVTGIVGVVNLIGAYRSRSVVSAVGAATIWFIIVPAVAFWWARRASR